MSARAASAWPAVARRTAMVKEFKVSPCRRACSYAIVSVCISRCQRAFAATACVCAAVPAFLLALGIDRPASRFLRCVEPTARSGGFCVFARHSVSCRRRLGPSMSTGGEVEDAAAKPLTMGSKHGSKAHSVPQHERRFHSQWSIVLPVNRLHNAAPLSFWRFGPMFAKVRSTPRISFSSGAACACHMYMGMECALGARRAR